MRILHTSDWHLGRSFHGTGMIEHQRAVIDEIVEIITTEKIDLLLVSGDIYDRALPAVDAVTLLDESLARIRETGATLVLTSGNHDSASRLGFGSALMATSGVHVRTCPESITEPIIINDDGARVVIWGIPYLEPRLIAPGWEVAQNHTAVITEAISRINQTRQEREFNDSSTVHILMAHLFAAGGSGSDSEKDIGEGTLVGSLGQVSTSVFEEFDYAALGHLHGRQIMSEKVRYSGSPVAYSFSEAGHIKGGWILETSGGKLESIRPVDFEAGPKLFVLSGKIDDLLTSETYQDAETGWCQITVTDSERPARAYQRLKDRFPGLLNFILAPEGVASKRNTEYAQKLDAAKNDLEICTDFVEHVRSRPVKDEEKELLVRGIEDARARETEEATR